MKSYTIEYVDITTSKRMQTNVIENSCSEAKRKFEKDKPLTEVKAVYPSQEKTVNI